VFLEKKISSSMREQKTLQFKLDVKSIDNSGRFAGYASVFDMVDNQRDVIIRGAFSRSIKDRVHSIKLLWQHQQDEPIGVFDSIFEDEHGLYVEGRLLFEVQRAREAYELLKSGAIRGLSIGYSPVRYRIDATTGVRILSEVDLWEVSLVTFAANEAASVTVVKQFEPILTNHEIEQWNQAAQTGGLIELSGALDRAISTLKA
jgi:HK97 family phage prohead protease